MFRTSCKYLKLTLTSPLHVSTTTTSSSSAVSAAKFLSTTPSATPFGWPQKLMGAYYSTSSLEEGKNEKEITFEEAKRLMRLVNVDELKKKLGVENREVIEYSELVGACEKMGLAKSAAEANDFARVLDEAGVVLLFRDKVYLNPDKVVDVIRKVAPFALLLENDPVKDELNKLEEEMKEINKVAYKQVRCILWTGLGLSVMQVGLFFRLTFWEFSWDVMEPIAFFTTATGIVVGYAYFLYTSRDPTYQDFMKRLFLSRQRKVMKKYNFDVSRFVELQKQCRLSQSSTAFAKREMGIEVKPEDLLHGHSQS